MRKRWGDSPLRWMECLLFLDIRTEVAKLDVHYGQDKRNTWEPPVSWGLAGPQRRLEASSSATVVSGASGDKRH